MDNTPDPLDPLLDKWMPPPPTPRQLRAEVWRRIAVVEAEDEAPSLWERIEATFNRPSFAITFVAACMLAGLFIAELRVTQVHSRRNAQFATSYLSLIDPMLADARTAASAEAPKLP